MPCEGVCGSHIIYILYMHMLFVHCLYWRACSGLAVFLPYMLYLNLQFYLLGIEYVLLEQRTCNFDQRR